MSRNIVSIHQPNFFPWLGYFAKILRSNIFVFLDDAQYQKKGGTWCNRVKIIQNKTGLSIIDCILQAGVINIRKLLFSYVE